MGSDNGMDYATVASADPFLGNPGPGFNGPLQTLGDEFAPAFEAVLGWNFGNGTDVRGTLNYYDHDESETLTTDGIPFLTLTQTRGSSNAGPGVAQARLDRRVISGLRAHREHCCMLSTWIW